MRVLLATILRMISSRNKYPMMKMINRSDLIIRPKEPYLPWATGVDGAVVADAHVLHDRAPLYLAPEDPNAAEETPPLADYFKEASDCELLAWCRDSTTCPKERDLETLREWFAVEGQSVVVGLCSWGGET